MNLATLRRLPQVAGRSALERLVLTRLPPALDHLYRRGGLRVETPRGNGPAPRRPGPHLTGDRRAEILFRTVVQLDGNVVTVIAPDAASGAAGAAALWDEHDRRLTEERQKLAAELWWLRWLGASLGCGIAVYVQLPISVEALPVAALIGLGCYYGSSWGQTRAIGWVVRRKVRALVRLTQ